MKYFVEAYHHIDRVESHVVDHTSTSLFGPNRKELIDDFNDWAEDASHGDVFDKQLGNGEFVFIVCINSEMVSDRILRRSVPSPSTFTF